MNRKGISGIIATLLLIVLTIVLIAVVWAVVNNLVKGKIEESSACFGNFEEVTLNDLYSCYDSSLNKMHISLNIGDIEADSVTFTVSSPSQSKSFTITDKPQSIEGVTYYDGSSMVALPGKNSGITYFYSWSGSDTPNSVQIAPKINGQQCPASDSITTIDDCALF
jgi:flagellin-like protein